MKAYLQERQTTVRATQLRAERRLTKPRRHHRKNKVSKLLQMPIRQGWQVKWKMRRLKISDGTFRVQASAVLVCSRWSKCWEALWPCTGVPEILQMRTAAQAWNIASKYGPYCELFFFLIKNELVEGEAFVGMRFGLCDCIRTVETRGTVPKGGHEDTLFQGVLGLRPALKGA